MKSLKSLLEDYNSCLEDSSKDVLSLDEVLDVAALEAKLQDLGVWCQKTMPEKREVMDAYLLLCRSQEEILMLTEDIQNVISFYNSKASCIIQIQGRVEPNTPYNRGIKSLLHSLWLDVSSLLERAKQTYLSMLQETDADIYTSDSDDDSISSDDIYVL